MNSELWCRHAIPLEGAQLVVNSVAWFGLVSGANGRFRDLERRGYLKIPP